ncbi:hypothetical protein HUS70_09060 [Pandoraea nosoerga]|uniref:Uncharacterized protein n=1 Tax=Pandoraea nosoerga TaxID=2508296 RepID=A0A5E4XA19_9BURK|nr:hypothetical protein [Pandoraea nosoerga]MBN4665048.1 hypothetical protein [Pandoraea nosoerga]MBN4675236.1 hypothetical protein [Pandoraea nosoerga]MBN4680791.1 hypothetical protein [Pandoraea nosoerga]MBN4744793.1 hypothetical protein [Pandoraea nosoerga]VVE33143.1 hypothetical protein PNO31109_03742 [Pandoraea nosoerga]
MTQFSAAHAGSLFATMLVAVAPAMLPGSVRAEPATPGDLVIERNIGPRIAYRGLPREQNPIGIAVPAFPTGPFNTAMGAVKQVTDNELTGHGSAGLITSTVQSGISPVMGVLVGNARGGNALNTSNGVGGGFAGAMGGSGGVGSIGTLVPSVISSALAPLTSIGAAGAAK